MSTGELSVPATDHARVSRARLRVAGLTAAGVAAVSYVAAVDPTRSGHYPGCPLLALTGWYCPGCGGLRAVHALTHGDVGAAFGSNPLLLVLLPVLAAGYAGWAWRGLTGRPHLALSPRARQASLTVGLVLALVVVPAFWVYRNLPAGAWAAP